MLFDLSLLFFFGIVGAQLAQKGKLPPLVGMLVCGILLGQSGFALFSVNFYEIAPTFRQIALIIILLRAGLQFDFRLLKELGWSAFLLAFLPAIFEIAGVAALGMWLMGCGIQDALILGCVVSAVSPAILVPRMLALMQHHHPRSKKIATLLLAGASVDDVVVLVLFGIVTSTTSAMSFGSFFYQLSSSLLLGIGLGLLLGWCIRKCVTLVQANSLIKALCLLAIGGFLLQLEALLAPQIAYSALLSLIVIGTMVHHASTVESQALEQVFGGWWQIAQLFLFVSIGANLSLSAVQNFGITPWILVLGGMIVRSVGTLLSLAPTPMSKQERLFCVVSYLPKATVQASIGAMPLALGFAIGPQALSLAILSILLCAPLGAWGMDFLAQRVFQQPLNPQ
ncbi:MAG: cation:proton antiporter [Erysipelotrichaceae bacterium]